MKKMILIPVLLVLLAAGASYAFVFAQPAKNKTNSKIDGTVVVLPKEFLVNLADGRYAKLSVGLVLAPGQETATPAVVGSRLPDGYAGIPQEAAIRDIVTNVTTDQSGSSLISERGRSRLRELILASLREHTDVKVNDVLLTDVAVQ